LESGQRYEPNLPQPMHFWVKSNREIPSICIIIRKMAKIIIVRHGQTLDNEEKVFSGFRDVGLDEAGIKEAQNLAEKLKNEQISKAYSSDQIRSKQTLEIILKYHPNVPVVADPRIKERDYGDLTGTSKIIAREKTPDLYKLWHRSYDVEPPRGESLKMVETRVLSFLHDILPNLKPDDVVLISAHGNSIRPMRRYFEHLSIDQMCTYEYASGEIFEYQI